MQHVRSLVQMLGNEFYVDEAAVIEAIRLQRSFNLLHLATIVQESQYDLLS